MRFQRAFLFILLIISLLLLSGCQGMIDALDTARMDIQYQSDSKLTTIQDVRCIYDNEYDSTCSGCYWKYGEPYACTEREEDTCELEAKQISLEEQGYTDCFIKDYTETYADGSFRRSCVGLGCRGCPDGFNEELVGDDLQCVEIPDDSDVPDVPDIPDVPDPVTNWFDDFLNSIINWLGGIFK